jgi:hypothetical protein
VSQALLRRHWPGVAHAAAANATDIDPHALLRMRAWHDAAPRAMRARELARLEEVYGDETIQMAIFHLDSFAAVTEVAEAAIPLGRPDAHQTLLGGEHALRLLQPRPLPPEEWARCCLIAFFRDRLLWVVPLDCGDAEAPHVNVTPSQPFFRATEGEERWLARVHGRGGINTTVPNFHASLGLPGLGGETVGGNTGTGVIVAHVSLDLAFPASAPEPPLSHVERTEVAAWEPLRAECAVVQLAAEADAFSFPSRYALLKTLDLCCRVPRWRAARPTHELAARFDRCLLVLEVLHEDGSLMAFSHCPVVGPATATAAAAAESPGPARMPALFQRGGAPLVWAEGAEPLPASDIEFCYYRVLLFDPIVERAATVTDNWRARQFLPICHELLLTLNYSPNGDDDDGAAADENEKGAAVRVRLDVAGALGETDLDSVCLENAGMVFRLLDMCLTGILTREEKDYVPGEEDWGEDSDDEKGDEYSDNEEDE